MRNRIRPFTALRCFLKVGRDPDDTEAGARLVHAMSGDSAERLYQRFRAHPDGARILAERRDIGARLRDRAALRRLPQGTLGRAYADFMDGEGISAEALADVTAAAGFGGADLDPDRKLVLDRVRDLHDLWHVVTGYSRDLVGELALVAFTWTQLRNPAFAVLTALGFVFAELRAPGARTLVRDGLRRGKRAPWMIVVDWHEMLPRPLDEVRETLRLRPVPSYTPLRSRGAPALGAYTS